MNRGAAVMVKTRKGGGETKFSGNRDQGPPALKKLAYVCAHPNDLRFDVGLLRYMRVLLSVGRVSGFC